MSTSPDLSSEAVARLRELAAENPAEHLPELARRLRLRADAMIWSRPDEALEAYRDSLGITRELAAEEPVKYLDEQAACLASFGSALCILGHCPEAIERLRDAVEMYRQLAVEHPEPYWRRFDLNLNWLNRLLRASGRFEEAVTLARAAVTQARDAGHSEHLAESLRRLRSDLAAVGELEAGVSAAKEAVAIRREISRRTRDGEARREFAMSLIELGYALALVGRLESLAVIPQVVWIGMTGLERARIAEQGEELSAEAFIMMTEFPAQLILRNLQRAVGVLAATKFWHHLPAPLQQRGLGFVEWRPKDQWGALCAPRPPGWTPVKPIGVDGPRWSWAGRLGTLKL